MINWQLGIAPDVGGMFQKGFDVGQSRSALRAFAQDPTNGEANAALMQADPAAYVNLRQNARQDAVADRGDRFRMAARNALLGNGPNGPAANPSSQPNALMPAPAAQSRPTAPQAIVSPAAPDTQAASAQSGGLRINPAAMQELYNIDPEAALIYQTALSQANREQAKVMQDHGVWLAKTAYYLSQFRTPDGQPDIEARRAAAQQILPELEAKGISANELGQFGFTDDELNKFMVFGQSLGQLIDDDRADARFQADVANQHADNARADREAASRDRYRQERIRVAGMKKGDGSAPKKKKGGKAAKAAAPSAGEGMTATNPQTGEKIIYRGGQWVPHS